MENYRLEVARNGRLYLYHLTSENGVLVDNLLTTFADWYEFFSVMSSCMTFTVNPFDAVGKFYVHVVN